MPAAVFTIKGSEAAVTMSLELNISLVSQPGKPYTGPQNVLTTREFLFLGGLESRVYKSSPFFLTSFNLFFPFCPITKDTAWNPTSEQGDTSIKTPAEEIRHRLKLQGFHALLLDEQQWTM